MRHRSRAIALMTVTPILGLFAGACSSDDGLGDARADARRDGTVGVDTMRSDADSIDGDGGGGGACGATMPCPAGRVCAEGMCALDLGPCTSDNDCRNDGRCSREAGRCIPNEPGRTNPMCTRNFDPGVFAPSVQCRFSDPPMGDAFPAHMHVLSTPMVADFRVYGVPDGPPRPSIVAVFDDGDDGGSENPTGLIRVLDGRTCTLQQNLSEQLVSHSSPVAIGDLDGDGTAEIVAFKAGGGLVAFRFDFAMRMWRVMWRSTARDGTTPFNPSGGGWAGPTIADIDNDGHPEVFRHGTVFNGRTGALIGGQSVTAVQAGHQMIGLFSIVQDVDEDGEVELVTGSGVYRWNAMTNDWVMETYYVRSGCTGPGCGEGHVAVANFGAYTSMRITDGDLPEIAVVALGYVRIDTIDGRTVFGPIAIPLGGAGGAPTVADFDGDGLPEIAAAGASRYAVYDPDCAAMPGRTGGRCGTASTTGVLWASASQDASSNVTGSTSFDFEGDGRVEAVYADECFARVYDGSTGEVLFSQHHSSCTWYENPVVADVDGDFRAEIVVGSNFNCGNPVTGIACPGVGARSTDAQFSGIRCRVGTDCISGTCNMGFCRCTMDTQCCPPMGECTYVCEAPPAGTAGTGNTCRASRPVGVRGIRVYNDVADRWVRSRMVWNQHAYNVTNVTETATIPRTSAVARNWRDRTLNNFRTNVQGSAERGATPDATTAGSGIECTGSTARLTARACNRGTAPLPDGSFVGFYDGDPAMGGAVICRVATPRAINPGECTTLSCDWPMPPMMTPRTVYIRVDDDGSSTECFEGNNLGTIPDAVCRPPA